MSGAASKGRRADPMSVRIRPVALGPSDVVLERRAEGTIYARSPHPLAAYPRAMTGLLSHWAAATPDRVFLAERNRHGRWNTVTYREAFASVRAIAAHLLRRGLSRDRPLAMLSGNDLNQGLLSLAAQYVGVPIVPISPAYSLLDREFGKLRHIIALVTPGLVYASSGTAFGPAIAATVPADAELVVGEDPPASRVATRFASLTNDGTDPAVEAAHAAVGPETVAKILFTSGSTGVPKGVINTQRMLCANQAMIRAAIPFLAEEPPVLVDWLPWSHTFGANHNFGIALFNGGTLYIDDGRPLPGQIEATVRNLKDIAPNIYLNVPRGYDALVPFLRDDRELARNFFSRLKLLFYAGASLPQRIWDALREISLSTVGERVRMTTCLGSTETAPAALFATQEFERAGYIGVPMQGVELKLVPIGGTVGGGKLEARLKGPNITPGYWKRADLTREAFDEEGFYRLGDALRFMDENDANKGFIFDGRLAEDFKLATGTWVNVGPLRTDFVSRGVPLIRDAVIAGHDRDYLAVLLVPNLAACRIVCADLAADAPPAEVYAHPRLRERLAALLDAHGQAATGSSNRILRALVVEANLSMELGELTDKGSINPGAVLHHRADLVAELYADPPGPRVITAGGPV